MPRNGSGTYTLSGDPLVDGAIAEATGSTTAMQPKLDDLATALTNSAARNGEGPATGNWPMAGFKLTGLAAGSSNGDSVRFEQINGVYQPLDATLTAFAALSGVADRLPYFTGADAFALATFTSFARTILDDTNAAAVLTTLGVTADAQLLLADADVARLGTANTWTGLNTFTTTFDLLRWVKSGAAANQGLWRWNIDGSDILSLVALSDAEAEGTFALNFLRSGNTVSQVTVNAVTEIELNATTFDLNGALDLSGNATIGGAIELGHASDTTLSRVSAGVVSIEGVNIVTVSATQTLTNKTLTSPTINGAALSGTFTGTPDFTGPPTINSAAINTAGKQTIPVLAGAMTPRTTNGAALAVTEHPTNDVMVTTLDFDQTTSEGAQFSIPMPKSWNEGTVTFTPYWTSAGGSAAQTVIWSMRAKALSDDDAIDSSWGTGQTSSDALIATGDLHIGPESSAITIGGTPAEGDLVIFEISRDVSDTLAADARLIAVRIHFTTNASNDT